MSVSSQKFEAGRLKRFLPCWKSFSKNEEILQIVSGCRINFESHDFGAGSDFVLKFSPEEKSSIAHEIDKLLEMHAIEQVSEDQRGFVTHIFTREKKDGSLRTILNLKQLNLFVEYNHFKMETLENALALVTKDCWMASIDLRNAYLTVAMHQDDKKYLQFRFEGKLFQYTCLPFGYSDAPRVFTKLLKPPLAQLRVEGHNVMAYLDDTFIVAKSKEKCERSVQRTIEVFESLGFVVHDEKSVVEPVRKIEFLGFDIDSVSMTVKVSQRKAEKLINVCKNLRTKSVSSIRSVASVVGKFVACHPGAEYAPLHFKTLEIEKNRALKNQRGNFDAMMIISESMKHCLCWWISHLHEQVRYLSHGNPDISVYCDASMKGWGGWIGTETVRLKEADGSWSWTERSLHINQLEIMAVLFTLKSLCGNYVNQHIRVFSDNTTAVDYINKMGGVRSPECNELARQVWRWCQDRNVWVSMAHIKGVDNVHADMLSRKGSETKEWSLNESRFRKIYNLWGPFDVDLFASRLNNKVDVFASWKPDPAASFIDAFSFDWSDKFFYAFPPFAMISKCVQKICFDRAEGVIVVPKWPTQSWYTRALQLASDNPRIMRPGRALLQLPGDLLAVHPLHAKLSLIAIRVSGRDWVESPQERPRSSSIPGGILPSLNIQCISRNGQNFVSEEECKKFRPL